MFGNKNVKTRKYSCKDAMKMVGFDEASTNNFFYNNDDVNHYYLEGFRPDADVSAFTLCRPRRGHGKVWVRKDSPF